MRTILFAIMGIGQLLLPIKVRMFLSGYSVEPPKGHFKSWTFKSPWTGAEITGHKKMTARDKKEYSKYRQFDFDNDTNA